ADLHEPGGRHARREGRHGKRAHRVHAGRRSGGRRHREQAPPARRARDGAVESLQTELVPNRLEVLKTLAPAVRRVWIIFYSVDLGSTPMITRALETAQRLKLDVVPRGVFDAGEVKRLLQEIRRDDAVLAPEGSNPELTIAIIEQSLARRVPAVFGTALWIGYGGLISYGPDYYAQGVQAAALVAKILRGARPQDLPVEGADKIDLAVNLKTAELLGLTVPRK